MRTPATVFGAATWLCLAAAAGQAGGTEPEQKEQLQMTGIYKIGHMVGGKLDVIGTITFDAAAKGTLALQATGPEADRLQTAWREVQALDRVTVKRTEETVDAQGNEVRMVTGTEVGRNDAAFPMASVEYLANTYGFFMTPP